MTTVLEETTHTLKVLDHTGDTKTLWNPQNQDEVDNAKKVFQRMKRKGFLAYSVGEDGSQGEVLQEFDPLAGAIIMTPQLVGG